MFYFLIRHSIKILVVFNLIECVGYSQFLSPGDVVVVGYNFKDPDEFALLSLIDLLPGTVFYITDCGWDGNAHAFRLGEGLISYTVPASGIHAGQQIHYPSDPGFTTQGVGGFFGLSQAGDQLLIFQGSWQSPQFIFGLSDYNGSWFDGNSSTMGNQQSFLPPELLDGQTALSLNLYIQARFECAFAFSNREEFLQRLCDSSQWVKSVERVTLPILACGFEVLALPVTWMYEWEGKDRWSFCNADGIMKEVQWEYWDYGAFHVLDCTQSSTCYSCKIPAMERKDWMVRSCHDGRCEKVLKLSNEHLENEAKPYVFIESDVVGLKLPYSAEVEYCRLYNLQGQMVWMLHRPNQSLVWLEGLTPGLYLLTIERKTDVLSIPFVR